MSNLVSLYPIKTDLVLEMAHEVLLLAEKEIEASKKAITERQELFDKKSWWFRFLHERPSLNCDWGLPCSSEGRAVWRWASTRVQAERIIENAELCGEPFVFLCDLDLAVLRLSN